MMHTISSIDLLAHAGHADHLGRTGSSAGVVVALLGAVVAVVAARSLLARSRDTVIGAVALCSGVAGVIHAVVTPEHFEEHVLFGLFFLAVTVLQMGVVVAALHRPSRALWIATAVGTVGVLALWALSRTVGLPIGPEPWTAEPTGLPDVACALYEAGVVFGCLELARARSAVSSTTAVLARVVTSPG